MIEGSESVHLANGSGSGRSKTEEHWVPYWPWILYTSGDHVVKDTSKLSKEIGKVSVRIVECWLTLSLTSSWHWRTQRERLSWKRSNSACTYCCARWVGTCTELTQLGGKLRGIDYAGWKPAQNCLRWVGTCTELIMLGEKLRRIDSAGWETAQNWLRWVGICTELTTLGGNLRRIDSAGWETAQNWLRWVRICTELTTLGGKLHRIDSAGWEPAQNWLRWVGNCTELTTLGGNLRRIRLTKHQL